MNVSHVKLKPMGKRRVKSYPPLTKEQQKLVVEHQWISGYEAHKARSRTWGHTGALTREDLTQVANFALCVAAIQYNPDRGVKFSTYACNKARGYLQHALRDKSRMVRTPRWIEKVRNQVLEGLKKNMSYSEIAEELGIPESRVATCHLAENNYHLSYDSNPEDWSSQDFIHEDDEVLSTLGSPELRDELKRYTEAQIDKMVRYAHKEPMSEEDLEWAADEFHRLKDIAYGVPIEPGDREERLPDYAG